MKKNNFSSLFMTLIFMLISSVIFASDPIGLSFFYVGHNSIKLGWNENSNVLGTSYLIQESLNGVSFTTVKTTQKTAAVLTGITPDTHYYYRVIAQNGVNISGPSNIIDIVTPSDAVVFSNGQDACTVLGQKDFLSATPYATIDGLSGVHNPEYDPNSNKLFVADWSNSRVLVYDLNNQVTGMNASFVLGQSHFNSNIGGVSQNIVNQPTSVEYDPVHRRLFVADWGNHRVLVYDLSLGMVNGMNASYVLGQPDFSSNGYSSSPSDKKIAYPHDLEYSPEEQLLFVADGYRRVVVFDLKNGITNYMSASKVIGAPNFTTTGGGVGPQVIGSPFGVNYDQEGKRLFVGDRDNHRVLIYDLSSGISNGMSASFVLGQNDFNSNSSGLSQNKMNLIRDITFDAPSQRLFVPDEGNNRVMIFDLSAGINNGMNASTVLGQPDFLVNAAQTTRNKLTRPLNLEFDPLHKKLFVADFGNNRMLIYSQTCPAPSIALSVTGVTINSATLSWVPEVLPSGTNYQVERATSSSGIFTVILTTPTQTTIDNGLSPNTTYFYRVTANSGAVVSNVISVITPAEVAPAPPAANPVATVPLTDGTNRVVRQVLPKVFSPNGDGYNDVVVFYVNNPNNESIGGTIYDIQAAKVAELVQGPVAGISLKWNGKDDFNSDSVPGGIYFWQISVGNRRENGSIVVAK